jgi:hypothetical protein
MKPLKLKLCVYRMFDRISDMYRMRGDYVNAFKYEKLATEASRDRYYKKNA